MLRSKRGLENGTY